MSCPFCLKVESEKSYYPSTFFNNKRFDYIKCKNCSLIYLQPFPSDEDYDLMYPPTYQSGINNTILKNPYKKLLGLRFSYGYQFDLIKKLTIERSILDYGCGNANFLCNAIANGFECDGVEFGSTHVSVLKKELVKSEFHIVQDFFKSPKKYLIIRMSNVLEHLENPSEIIKNLLEKLDSNGLLLIEGPIEANNNFALFTRKVYFLIRGFLKRNSAVSHIPTHIFFSNSKNQKSFFEQFKNLKTIHYEVSENAWPYPESFTEAKGSIRKVQYFLAKISMALRFLNKNWGNTFIYIGKKQFE